MPNLLRPSTGNITNGYRSESAGPGKPIHLAVDFGWGKGKYVVASMPGVLTFDKSSGYGLRATIAHPDGSFTRYAHLESGSPERPVSMGEVLGVMGDTGTLAKGVHLHFEWIVRGSKRDPTPYFVTQLPKPTPNPEEDITMATALEVWQQILPGITNPGQSSAADYVRAINTNVNNLTTAIATLTGKVDAIKTKLDSIPAGGGLTAAQNDALMAIAGLIDPIPTQTEMSGIITNQYNLLRTGATNDKNEILAAIDEIPGGSAPQNLTVTLTGTAEAAQ